MKVRFNRYLHSSKEDNWDLVKKFKDEDLKYIGYEVELTYEYDTKTKKCNLMGVNGHLISETKINPKTIKDIPEYDGDDD